MFKVGDKVKRYEVDVTIEAIKGSWAWVDDGNGPFTTPTNILTLIDPPPTPPEGREVEGERRVALVGDIGWTGQEWIENRGFSTEKCWCLRPLPSKPKGDGWEWRKPTDGDERQTLYPPDGETVGPIVTYSYGKASEDVRLGYRWCRRPLPTLGQVAMDAFCRVDCWVAADASIRGDWERVAAAVVREYEARKQNGGA